MIDDHYWVLRVLSTANNTLTIKLDDNYTAKSKAKHALAHTTNGSPWRNMWLWRVKSFASASVPQLQQTAVLDFGIPWLQGCLPSLR